MQELMGEENIDDNVEKYAVYRLSLKWETRVSQPVDLNLMMEAALVSEWESSNQIQLLKAYI